MDSVKPTICSAYNTTSNFSGHCACSHSLMGLPTVLISLHSNFCSIESYITCCIVCLCFPLCLNVWLKNSPQSVGCGFQTFFLLLFPASQCCLLKHDLSLFSAYLLWQESNPSTPVSHELSRTLTSVNMFYSCCLFSSCHAQSSYMEHSDLHPELGPKVFHELCWDFWLQYALLWTSPHLTSFVTLTLTCIT